MARFFVDLGITTAVFLPLFLLTSAVLWRLKDKGAYTLLLAFVFEIVFLFAGYAVAPQAMRYHHKEGMPPVVQGIAMGCCMPMLPVILYHLAQRRKKREKTP